MEFCTVSWDKGIYKLRIQGEGIKFRLYLKYPQGKSEMCEKLKAFPVSSGEGKDATVHLSLIVQEAWQREKGYVICVDEMIFIHRNARQRKETGDS